MSNIIHIDTPALGSQAFNPIGRQALAVIAFSALKEELEALREHLELPAEPLPLDDIEESEWETIITDLLDVLGPLPESGISARWGRVATHRDSQVLTLRLAQALAAIDHAQRCVDSASTATGALLPLSFARRVELLLGGGQLPVAWVRVLDVLRF